MPNFDDFYIRIWKNTSFNCLFEKICLLLMIFVSGTEILQLLIDADVIINAVKIEYSIVFL